MRNEAIRGHSRRGAVSPRISSMLPHLFAWLGAHRRLPFFLQAWMVAPGTLLLVIGGAVVFELPPGPLCDEGMILFMEGGCDWGESNIFFFSKAGLLVTMNLVFTLAWIYHVRDWRAFLPHFGILTLLTAANYSDEYCRHYYSHPNGSIGQMTAEAIAFGALGVMLLSLLNIRSVLHFTIVITVWNVVHVATFYLALLLANHWTWLHTFLIVIAFSSVAAALVLATRERPLPTRPNSA